MSEESKDIQIEDYKDSDCNHQDIDIVDQEIKERMANNDLDLADIDQKKEDRLV